ncbi:uncharacterized protein LOC110844728 [Folsomia candida]|uniref:Uncharacterized protein n=1 Tax=Folsomia candida TaxID=158441 RepID=A0A226ER15_FOLCA|nr:uncharacterized protein LOC110844728 [Folsomia candida]XP_035704416.1 uncharacterized protein LOC110844728 [Folsomia candida]OXA60073.1 hypothetical protein Fcan01_04937 [Folsomia candida]
MEKFLKTVMLLIAAPLLALASDFGYQYSYSCWRDCGYYKTQEFSFCSKYQRDYCWAPSRRTIMIVALIVTIIVASILIYCCLRRCNRRQEKSRPTSPPPGSMCIWQA